MIRPGKQKFLRLGSEQVFDAGGDTFSHFDLAANHPVMPVRISQERSRPFMRAAGRAKKINAAFHAVILLLKKSRLFFIFRHVLSCRQGEKIRIRKFLQKNCGRRTYGQG
jgi:hypothetical protein